MTQGETLAIVSQLVGAYSRDLTEATLEIYCQDLCDLAPDTLMRAVVQLRRTSKWLPTIAEIRAAVVDQATDFPSPAVAWDTVVARMRKLGTYRPPGRGSGDPVFRALELCGDWESCCQEDATWLRKRYVEIYEQLVTEARHGLAAEQPPAWLVLPGGRPRLTVVPPRLGEADA
jgi:hypothetical protein